MLDFIQKRKTQKTLSSGEAAGLLTEPESIPDSEETEKNEKGNRFKLGNLRSVLENIKISKRNLVIAASVFVIGIAVYLNWFFFSGSGIHDGTSTSGMSGDNTPDDAVATYFAVTQVNRQRARDEAMDTLQNVIEDPSALEDAKSAALSGISKIADEIAMEADIETLIKGKGFEECVAIVNGENANIVVKSQGLLPNEISQIQEIVYEVSKILPMNMKIIEKKA